MTFVCQYDRLFRRATIVLLLVGRTLAGTITPNPSPTAPAISVQSNGTCEFRTINYITDTLPQQCLKSAWSASNATSLRAGDAASTAEHRNGNTTATYTDSADPTPAEATVAVSTTTPEAPIETDTDLEPGELDEASFLSFEEWKKQTLDKEKESTGGKKSGEGFQNHLDALDESELEVDFSNFNSGTGSKNTPKVENDTEEGRDERELEEKSKKRDPYRSKDAGKTCKERFSYASFDAGATVLKTHKGAKNAKSVLIENKDSYMLSECSEENKFIIIELSEDIWIDTLVLANYEFFSSMIRTFRVSVSDRYPVPVSKWKDIGTYEARNSRDIQAFLVENPQIWARYIRIEFLSHFGNEYYCPLSLVRVHGTRMLESWKMEGSVEEEEEETEEIEEPTENEGYIPEAVAQVVREEEERLRAAAEEVERATELMAAKVAAALNTTSQDTNENTTSERPTTVWEKPGFNTFGIEDSMEQEDVCLKREAPKENSIGEVTRTVIVHSTVETAPTFSIIVVEETKSSHSAISSPPVEKIASESLKISPTSSIITSNSTSVTASSSHINPSTHHNTKSNVTSASAQKNKTATATSSSSSSLPTIQESFFKAVSRRLSLLESNSTLSLAYISEQSKFLREAFTKVEKKQLQKTNQFLDTLNTTVLAELRGFRQQYDEIWQSTVISLESQREESRRELLAVTERLGILGEEVVWQRRMSIVQSVLLLLCLGLVIFSRVSSTENLPFHIPRSRRSGLESPIEGDWLGHHRQTSEDDQIGSSRELSRSPPTLYERELTPPSEEVDDTINQSFREDEEAIQQNIQSPNLEVPNPLLRRTKSTSSYSYISTSPGLSPANSIRVDSSPRKGVGQSLILTPTKKKRKNSGARKRGMSQSAPAATPPLSSAVSPNPFNVLSSRSPSLKSKRSQLHTPETTPDAEVVAVGDTKAEADSPRPSSMRKFSIARKPLPALPTG